MNKHICTDSGALTDHTETNHEASSRSLDVSLANEGAALWGDIGHIILNIDNMIRKCDTLLERLQPPAPGRIRVAWWACSVEWVDTKCPLLVRWKRGSSGVWTATRMDMSQATRSVKRSGWFFDGAESTRETLSVVVKLIALRERILSALSYSRMQIMKFAPNNEEGLISAEGQLLGIENWLAMQGGELPWRKAMPQKESKRGCGFSGRVKPDTAT